MVAGEGALADDGHERCFEGPQVVQPAGLEGGDVDEEPDERLDAVDRGADLPVGVLDGFGEVFCGRPGAAGDPYSQARWSAGWLWLGGEAGRWHQGRR